MKTWIQNLLLAAIAALAPIHSVLIVVGILIVVDTITGVWAAVKNGQTITSARLRDTITKMLLFQLAVITGFLLEKYLLADLLPVSKLIAGIIGVTEGTSILENINKIRGDNLFKTLIDKLGSVNKTEQPPNETKQ